MISFYSNNLADSSDLTGSNENLLFPVENIQDPRRTKVFRSQTNTDSVVFDFGSAKDLDSVIIVDNPRSGFGFTSIELQLNSSNSWGAPAFTQSITPNSDFGIAFAEFATQTYRYARLVMTSSLGYCELANVFLGEKIEFENGTDISLGWTYIEKDLSTVKENRYGQKFVDIIARQKQISFNLDALNKDELDIVLSIHDSKGVTSPFFMRLGTDDMINDKDRFAGMVYMNSIPSIKNIAFGLYDLSMSLEEAM